MASKQMKQKTKAKKTVKKSFYEIRAPMTATKIELYAGSPEEIDGKIIKLDLTKNLRGKSLELKLRVKNEDGKLTGIPESAQLMTSYIRRVMRKSADYSEDSFEADCRDSVVRVKPLLVTRRRVSRAVLKALRDSAKEFLTKHLKTRTSEEIFSELMANKLQKQMALKLKKIYPLALCEIRMFHIVKGKKPKKAEESPNSEKE
jgi:ribosomal protein S3AE